MTDGVFSYKAWYEQYGDKLNTARKAKYNLDPEYRKRVLEMNQRSRDKKREESASELKAEEKAKKTEKAGSSWKEMVVQVQDDAGVWSAQTVVTIGGLASVLGKSIKSIRLWEKSGLIPPAPFRSLKGDRLYPPSLVLEIHEKLLKAGRVSTTGPQTRPRAFKHTVRFDDGHEEVMALFPVGVLAENCGRNISTIEQMEAKGQFPATPLRSHTTGYRLYTAGMIEAAKEVFSAKRESGPVAWDLLFKAVKERWIALGIGDKSQIQP
jgi:DNA-binding transcriptional MerR regulator